ncbi:MAG TPA: hypothetical protein VEK79_07495 [Thermoanaerobaculia bacterium]|nr:hypothetical protein [Thermoanaerobaculia bacterium]
MSRWRLVAESLTRPYPVRLPMVLLVALDRMIPVPVTTSTFAAPSLPISRCG